MFHLKSIKYFLVSLFMIFKKKKNYNLFNYYKGITINHGYRNKYDTRRYSLQAYKTTFKANMPYIYYHYNWFLTSYYYLHFIQIHFLINNVTL